ncbi:MAG: phytanoyl-CoA dioxygenase [Rhodospirillaceae bacterium]|nr:phytanoyl-CoA dioxygenase [Rhodospirillaceae bacterium]
MEDPPKTQGKQSSIDENIQSYLKAGEQRAIDLGNRGPIKFDSDGRLSADIRESYSNIGFYIFENVISSEELKDLAQDLDSILENLPEKKGAELTKSGKKAIGADCKAPTLFWSKPLGDPFGGTALANGRHPVKMAEPIPAKGSPEETVYLILGSLQFSEACMRTYGHPKLLRVAAAINGDDFVPFTEALFIKEPGIGASVAWHRDGTTHWDNPAFDEGIHGFNFMIQLYGCTSANGVWVVPGTHKHRSVDIKDMVQRSGSERINEAVPMICQPGDVVMSNRQVVHGSFANTSPDWRVTINQGFHRRKSVLNVKGGGLHGAPATYDDARIRKRSSIIGHAIAARKQRFPNENAYHYMPFEENNETFNWDEKAKNNMHDYNLLDLSI